MLDAWGQPAPPSPSYLDRQLQQLSNVALLKAAGRGEELEAIAVVRHVRGGEHDGPVIAPCACACAWGEVKNLRPYGRG